MTYTYANRLRASLNLLQPSASAWTNGYTYDAMKRLTNITSQAGGFGYQYPASQPSQPSRLIARLSLPNGAYITNAYDSMTRLLNTSLKTSGGVVRNSHAYGYDLASRRTTLTNTAGDYRNFTYDNLGQLKSALGFESDGSARMNEKLGYNYDPAGNLNQRTNNALVQTFNVDNLNQLSTINRSGTLTVAGNTTTAATNVTVNSLSATRYSDKTWAKDNFPLVDSVTNFIAIAANNVGVRDTNTVTVNLAATNNFVCDLNGNLLSDGKRGMDYDDENQMIRVTVTNEFKKEFVYDGANRLRIRREFSWSGSAWTQTNETRFICDGDVPIQHRDSNNAPTLTLTRGLDLSGSFQGAGGIGGLLAMTESSGTHSYYHGDGNGNVTTLINANQLVVAQATYDPFGRFLSISGPKSPINAYWFSSELYDSKLDFYHYPRRVYIPSLQRFANRDPIGEDGGMNLFGFVGNDPINVVDPFGLTPTLNPVNQAYAAEALESAGQAGARSLAQQAATRAAVQRAFQEAAAVEARRQAIKAGLAAGATIIVLEGGEMYSPPLPNYGYHLKEGEYRDYQGNIRDAEGNTVRDKDGRSVECKKKYPKLGYEGTKPFKDALKKIQRGSLREGDYVDLGFIPTENQALQLLKDAGVDTSSKEFRIDQAHGGQNPHNYPHINYPTPNGGKGTIQIQ